MAKIAVLVAGLLIAESQASDVSQADPSAVQGFLSQYMTAPTQRSWTSVIDNKPAFTPAKEQEKAAEKLLANGSNSPITLGAIGVGLLALVTMLGARMRRGLQPATALAGMEMQSQAQVPNIFYSGGDEAKLGAGGMADTRDPEPFVNETDKRQSISQAPSFEEYLKSRQFAAVPVPAVFFVPPIPASQQTAMQAKLYDWKRREAAEDASVGAMEFRVDNIKPAPGSTKRKTRKGRGISAGQGATCGFGMRGQKSRSGRPKRAGFEGGQTPLYRQLPKLVGRQTGPGHQNEVFSLIKLEQLAGCDANAEVDFASLLAAGQVTKKKYDVVKVVGSAGDVSVPAGLTVKAHAFTGSARAAIEGAGGKCVELSKTTQEPVEA